MTPYPGTLIGNTMAKTEDKNISKNHHMVNGHFGEGENRRLKGDRINVLLPVFASSLKGDLIQGYLEAINISWSGMMIETNIPFQVKDEIILEFALPETDYTIETRARVVHKRDIDDDSSIIGVGFTQMDPNVRRMLTGYVLERLESPKS